MKHLIFLLIFSLAGVFACPLKANEPVVTITTNVGVMKAKLYDNVPNHVKTFIERAQKGEYNGTLFTRVIKDFMIQGGAEILPELRPEYFHKKGALAAPRQNDDVNPEKKSDMSQFFIVEGKVYRSGELDTLEKVKNYAIRKKALDLYYRPVKVQLQMLKMDNPREYNKRVAAINAKIDSMILATPGHLVFTDEQRKAYTTVGGCHHLDGIYTIFGELTEGFEVLDQIAAQKTDKYDRPLKDIRIVSITVENE